MNGKKAKLLRGLAGKGKKTGYTVVEGSEARKSMEDLLGTEHHFTTGTIKVSTGNRHVCKSLKKMYTTSKQSV